jgi:UDP-2,3-diacylglucosamine hydrolase
VTVAGVREVPLVPGTIVIADLHLDVATSEGTRAFAAWLDALESVPRLAILGDLFDVWVGPAQAHLPGAPAVLDALQRLVRRGTAVDLVPGNRDFLLERSFEARTGVHLHAEGFVGTAQIGPAPASGAAADMDVAGRSGAGGGQRTLFVHGDTLCTRDGGYQRLRRVLRSGTVRWLAPRVPLSIGTRVARRLRRASVRAVAQKLPDEKSIQREAVVAAARAERCSLLVCGHAHDYRDETLEGGLRLIVLDAFGGPRDVLRFESNGTWVSTEAASLIH